FDSSTQSGNDTTSTEDYLTNSYSLYQAGSSGPAGTSLSSVVLNQSSNETVITAQYSNNTRAGSNASSNSSLITTTYSSTGSGTSGGSSLQSNSQSGASTFTETSLSTVDSTSLNSGSLYEAGTSDLFGAYSFSSVVYNTGQESIQTTQQFSTQ